MSQVDLRGFSYPLEPERQRKQWQFDALLEKLGAAQRSITECESRRAALERDCAALAAQVDRSWKRRPDPANRQRMLAYLANQQQRKAQADAELGRLREQRDEFRRDCMKQQQALDLLDQHREDCRGEFEMLERSRLSAEADRDWIGRSLWRGNDGVGT